MRRKARPEWYKDQHLPLALVIALKETGCNEPPRAIRKRAALMQGRGANFTTEEIDSYFSIAMLEQQAPN
jgi:hypothetical protein